MLSFVPEVPSLPIGTVPEERLLAFMLAIWKVPKATMSTISPFDNAEANTTEFPEVTVTSTPLTCLTPLR